MTKQELIPNAVQYFEKDAECNLMLATTDGNFFHEKDSHFATAHAGSLPDKEIYTITRIEALTPISTPTVTENVTMTVKELKAACEAEGYPKDEWDKLKKADLIEYIEAKRSEPKESEDQEEETPDDGRMSPDEVTEEDAVAYKEDTGKPAVIQNSVTDGFIAWKESN